MFSDYLSDPSNMLELAGVAGFGLYVSNYLMLTLRVLTGNCLIYYLINISAATLVLAGLMNSFDLASALIQIFWICISTVGILMRIPIISRRRSALAQPGHGLTNRVDPGAVWWVGTQKPVTRVGYPVEKQHTD